MAKFLQKLVQHSFEQKATAYPTAAATMGTALYLGQNVKHTINDTANKIERRPSTSVTRDSKGYYLGPNEFKNSIEYEAIHFGLLSNAIGACSTSGTDPYTHVITALNTSLLPWFNFEHSETDLTTPECRIYNGCVIDNFTIACAKAEPVRCTADYAAAYKYTAGSAFETLSEDTTNPYMWHETRILLDLANSGAYTSSTELDYINNWSFKVSNTLLAEPKCGSTSGGNAITRPDGLARMYELNFEYDMSDDNLTDLINAATELAYQVYIYRGASDYLKVTIEDAQVMTAPDNTDAEG